MQDKDEYEPNEALEVEKPENAPEAALVDWIYTRITPWRSYRDTVHKTKWDEYYNVWRGFWNPDSKTRSSERSKLISPATMAATDSTISELEEAVFGRAQWFEIDEDLKESQDPAQRAEILAARDLLLERTTQDKVPAAVSKAFVIGTVFGTGIAKIVTSEKKEKYLEAGAGGMEPKERTRICVEVVPLEPYEFIPDPTTDDIDQMLGMGHETFIPLHQIEQAMEDGIYFDVDIGSYGGASEQLSDPTSESAVPTQDAVKILEWHGKVPAKYLLPFVVKDYSEADAEMFAEDESLIEAVVTIANDGTLIGAKKNPYFMEDRDFVAYQHDTVPGYFWGRGIPEKASNPQKTLDGTIRARQDALALVAHPMLRGDITRIPKGTNLGVWPGKFWPTTGAPGEIIEGFNLGQVNPDLFANAQDAERMVQVATGAMDPTAGEGGPTASAIAQAPFLKRAKRTMQNIERSFLTPLVQKIFWRYVQFDPVDFPKDYKVRVMGTVGIMARELESVHMNQLLALVPQETPPFFAILKSIFANSSNTHKADIVKAIDEFTAPKEPTPEEQQMVKQKQELEMRAQMAAVAKVEADAAKSQADAEYSKARAQKAAVETSYIDDEMQNEALGRAIDLREVQAFEQQNAVSAIMAKIRGMETAIKAMESNYKLQSLENDAGNLTS